MNHLKHLKHGSAPDFGAVMALMHINEKLQNGTTASSDIHESIRTRAWPWMVSAPEEAHDHDAHVRSKR